MQLHYEPELSFTGSESLPFVHTLGREESWHCVKVLRMRAGETIYLTNGRGELFSGALLEPHATGCVIKIVEAITQKPRNYHIHLAVATVKNMTRFEWFLEKATEMGVNEITPLICEHSEKISVRIERLNKIITSSMKQSLQAFHPRLNTPVHFKQLVGGQSATCKVIGWCEGPDAPLISEVVKPGTSVLALIGPEGDFSKEEILLAQKSGFTPISLGKNRLRTETAALAACFAVHFVNRTI